LPTPPLEASPNAPVSPHSQTQPQTLRVTPIGSVSSLLEVTSAPASTTVPFVPQRVSTTPWLLYLVPQRLEWQQPSSTTIASRIPHSSSTPVRLSSPSSIHFHFAFTLVLLSALLIVSATLPTHACEFRTKNEVISSNRIGGAPQTSDPLVHRPRPAQHTPHAERFVFDPGGSDFVLEQAPEDARGRESKTRGVVITTRNATHDAYTVSIPHRFATHRLTRPSVTFLPHLPCPSSPRLPSGSSPPRFDFAFVLATITTLISTFVIVSKPLTTHARKFPNLVEDFSYSRIGTPKSDGSTLKHRLRLAQYTPHADRLIIKPRSFVFVLDLAHEDAPECEPMSRASPPVSRFPTSTAILS
jgi:hypothetical protein